MPYFNKNNIVAALFSFAVLTNGTALNAQQEQEGKTPFLYPIPRTVGVVPHAVQGKPPGAVTGNRYAGVPEQERFMRELHDYCAEQEDMPTHEQPPCPLCEENFKTPCGVCKMCVAGFPCEKTLCRHCVQPRSKNMGSSCDLTAGDEPCGTCDACQEHRSAPCEHADDGYGRRGEFNPYREPRILSVIPRPVLDEYNNGARKFPVYYNPAPHYRPTWNPSMYAGYARPFTFRWSCGLCHREPCECNKPGLAGQVPYAYTCKFCNRNPCACAQEICDVNKPLDPKGTSQALAAYKGELVGKPQPVGERETRQAVPPQLPSAPGRSGGISVDELLDDSPLPSPDAPLRTRPPLDAPPPPATSPSGSTTVSSRYRM